MPFRRDTRARAPHHPFVGVWHITAMDLWDDDYVNMERQAFVEILDANVGSFQFGLVHGELDGYMEAPEDRLESEPSHQPPASTQLGAARFVFTWDGFDELNEVSGSGWMRLTAADLATGLIMFHGGDRSTFRAERARARRAR